MMRRSWDNLSPPLLELILDCLPVIDYVRFRAVCRSWYHVQTDHRLSRGPSDCQKAWLMLPKEVLEITPEKRIFYNPHEQRYYHLPLPEAAQGKCFLGASHGWLLYSNNQMVVLVNPFTCSDIHIPIPEWLSYYMSTMKLSFLSSSPTDPNCIVLLGSSRDIRSYFYCHISDKEWKKWTTSIEEYLLSGLAVCGGKLYMEVKESKLIVMDSLLVPVERCLDLVRVPQPTLDSREYTYLVEYNGEILLAIANYQFVHSDGTLNYDKMLFDVFKADLTQKMWVRLESLGEMELFLGGKENVLCLSAINTGRPGNRIYFTWRLDTFREGSDAGPMWLEYNYKTRQVVSCKLNNMWEERLKDELKLRKDSFEDDFLLWVVPSLC